MKKKDFWNDRASLGESAGTNDYLLKKLELELLRDRINPGSSIIDLGCGNGKTLFDLVESNDCTGIGIDFSQNMIKSAQEQMHSKGVNDCLQFEIGSLEDLPSGLGLFDYAVTERSLINLDGMEEQYKAFKAIMKLVKPGGRYLMIESSRQGLERINELRKTLKLGDIETPWHNSFLDEEEVLTWQTDEYFLEEVYPFSSSYYFLSRVLYAKLAEDSGEALRYDSAINLVAVQLPPVGDLGPARLWQWVKK